MLAFLLYESCINLVRIVVLQAHIGLSYTRHTKT